MSFLKKFKPLILLISVFIACYSIVYFVFAYSEPQHSPPTCLSGEPGCDAPINSGSTAQTKTGILNVGNGSWLSITPYLNATYLGGFGAQKINARASAFSAVAGANPGQSFSLIMLAWNGATNNLDTLCQNLINSSWHAQVAVKGNYFYQPFNDSDFWSYSTAITSQAEFDTYRSTGTQWWVGCSTLPAWSKNTGGFWQDGGSGKIYYNNGNVGIGTTGPAKKLEIKGSHSTTQARLFSDEYGQGLDGGNTAVMSLWASEPGWTWTGVGIGNNINGSPYYGRVSNTRGGSYIRLLDNSIYLSTVNNSGTITDNMSMSAGNVGIAANLSVGGGGSFGQPVSVGAPTAPSHAVTKSYLESVLGGGGGTITADNSKACNADGACETTTVLNSSGVIDNPSGYRWVGGGSANTFYTPSGYIQIGPLNAGWAHIYSDGKPFIFNTPVYSTGNAFSSYNGDLWLQRAGATILTLTGSGANVSGSLSASGNVSASGQVISAGRADVGNTGSDYLPNGANWQYNLLLNAQNNSSIGFHDSNASVSSIRYNNSGFTIGANDGWGAKSVSFPGGVCLAGVCKTDWSQITGGTADNSKACNADGACETTAVLNSSGVIDNPSGYRWVGGGSANTFYTPSGYIQLGPLNTGWAHIYSDGKPFIFNTPVYSTGNAFSSYNGDLWLQRAGETKLSLTSAGASVVGNLYASGQVISNGRADVGNTGSDYLPNGANWQYNLLLNAQDNSSIGFHDSNASVSSIRYNNSGFTIGANDGWGAKSVSFPGGVCLAGTCKTDWSQITGGTADNSKACNADGACETNNISAVGGISATGQINAASASGNGGYVSTGNYGGTGSAAYFPQGLWSNATSWIYGAVYGFNGTWYDVNNQSYYVDPASSSSFNNLGVAGNLLMGGGTRIAFNGSPITSGNAYGVGNGAAYNNLNSIAVDTLETDGGTGGGGTLELNYYGGNEVHIGPSGSKPLRAAILYDGYSGYYVDPAGISNLNAANFAGNITATGDICSNGGAKCLSSISGTADNSKACNADGACETQNISATGGALLNYMGVAWGGWNESIRFTNTSHAAITYPAGGLLFGMHSNRNMYWADTNNGWYSMYLEPAGNLVVRSGVYAPSFIQSGRTVCDSSNNCGYLTSATNLWTSSGANISNNNTGNVGIGTTNPGAKLEVAGQVKITGGTPGVNKVLTSDAAGLATWQTPAVAVSSVFGRTGAVVAVSGDYTTTLVTEGANLYFTNARALAAVQSQLDLKAPLASPTFIGNVTMPGIGIWNSSGNVGIGTTNPGANKLEVVGGPIKATGGLIMETRTTNPASPAVGQIWMCTDTGYDCQ